MQCPACPVSLVELRVGELELDECPRCLGMWFDAGELQGFLAARLATPRVQQNAAAPASNARVPARATCPRCLNARLQARTEGAVSVDGCGRCGGTWVTAPVISAILATSADEAAMPSTTNAGGTTGAPLPATEGATPPTRARSPASAVPSSGAAFATSAAIPTTPPSAGPARPGPGAFTGAPSESRSPAPPRLDAPLGGCTACNAPMSPVTHDGQAFHRCTSCEALFFPRGGLPFFLSRHARSWTPPSRPAPEPGDQPKCPGCSYAMRAMTLQGHPVRVWACTECWSMFASANGVRRLCRPEEFMEENLSQPAMALWRMLDAFTEWLVNPPKSGRNRLL